MRKSSAPPSIEPPCVADGHTAGISYPVSLDRIGVQVVSDPENFYRNPDLSRHPFLDLWLHTCRQVATDRPFVPQPFSRTIPKTVKRLRQTPQLIVAPRLHWLGSRHIGYVQRGNEPGDGGGHVAKEDRGFASMDRAKQREIASKGGKAAHQKGTAHEWTSEEARDAGRKGGIASHRRRREQLAATLGPDNEMNTGMSGDESTEPVAVGSRDSE